MLFVSGVVLAAVAFAADRPKTSDLVTISGSRAVRKWQWADRQRVGTTLMYVGSETIQIVPHGSAELDVVVSVRGIPEADLFLVDPRASGASAGPPCGQPRRSWLRFKTSVPVDVGYRVCFPADRFEQARGQIEVAVNGAEAERLAVAFERDEGLLETKILLSTLTALGGIVVGACLAFLGFLGQQHYLRKSEQAKAFRERKVQGIAKLRKFFTDEYPIYRQSNEPDEAVKVKALCEILIKADVYTLLPPDEMGKLNRLANGRSLWQPRESRLRAFDQFMSDNFGEFMLAQETAGR